MARLFVLFGLFLSLLGQAAAYAPPPRDIYFKVYRDGDEIGHHIVRFRSDGDRTVASVDIQLAVYFAGICMFRMSHVSEETWQNDRLQSLSSRTHDDGTDHSVRLLRTESGLTIEGTKYRGPADGSLVPTSYWFLDTVGQKEIIDSINGRVFPVSIRKVGRETIEAAGRRVEATRYTLTEQLVMNLWYDDNGQWVKTSFDARGSTVDYVLQPGPPPASVAAP